MGRYQSGIHVADTNAGDVFMIEINVPNTVFHSALEFLARGWSRDAGIDPSTKLLRVFFSSTYPIKETGKC